MQELIMQFIMWALAKHPAFATLIVMMGTLRLVFKPIMTAINEVVGLTETKVDDEYLKKVLSSKYYKAICWLIDFLASVKLPQAKK